MASDPYFDNVELLLHFNGSDGSTTFVDSSVHQHAITVYGSTALETSYWKFGGSSGAYTTYDDYLDTTVTNAMGTGDWCVEGWIWPVSLTSGFYLFWVNVSNWTELWINSSYLPVFEYYDQTLAQYRTIEGTVALNQNSWNHVAVTKAGSVLRIFVNGILSAQITDCDLNETSTSWGIGTWNNNDGNTSYLDDFRVTLGVARYTEGFSVPTAEFPNSAAALSSMSLSDSSSLTHIWGTLSVVSLNTAAGHLLKSNQSVIESLNLASAIKNIAKLSSTDSLTLSDSSVRQLYAIMPVVELLRLSSPVSSQYQLNMAIATELVFQTLIDNVKVFGDLVDTANFADVVEISITAVMRAIELIQLDTLSSTSLRIFTRVDELVELFSSSSQRHYTWDAVEDTISFFGSLDISGESYAVWAVHPSYPAATEYDNYRFNSFAQTGGYFLGAMDDGIYELGGSTDSGTDISAVIRTGLLDFGTSQLKQVTRAYLGYTSDNRLVLKTIATDGGQKTERWYELQDKTADAVRESRIKLGKGVKSRYWQFELVNVDGGDFEVDQLQLLPLMMSRRVKE